MSKKNMEVETLYAIREARGLKASEKALLFVLATRGKAFATAQTNADDMGASRSTYYDTRNALIEKGLIVETLRSGTSTIYVVIKEALRDLRDPSEESTEEGVQNLAEGCPESTTGGVQNLAEGCPESTTQRRHLREPSKEKGKESSVASVADAPEAANLESHEPQNTSDSDTSSESMSDGISEPLSSHTSEFENDSSSEPTIHLGPTTTGPVDNADVRDVETCESSSTPEAAAAKLDYGPMDTKRLEAALQRLRFSTIDQQRLNLLNFSPVSRKNLVLRAGKPEFYHLETAGDRVEAALTAMMAEMSSK